ncbi:MAG: SufD family Fe-S cluster assembly protein [Nitrososphaerota archaeon]|nr:SufD family Fe-S cluster assembly protein [Nitrososphaerota archaeon]MDG6939094.1 SufD family Fe-S cluster assembly protein [Nitrososphaerota archaeon]
MSATPQSLDLSRLVELSRSLGEGGSALDRRKKYLETYHGTPFETDQIFLKNYERPNDEPTSFDPADVAGGASDLPPFPFSIGCAGTSLRLEGLPVGVKVHSGDLGGDSKVLEEPLANPNDRFHFINAALRNSYQRIVVQKGVRGAVTRLTSLPGTRKALHRRTELVFGSGSALTFVDRIADPPSRPSDGFMTESADVVLEPDASVVFVLFSTGKTSVALNYRVRLGRNSRLAFSLWGGGNPYIRARGDIILEGEGADAGVFWGSYAHDRARHDMLTRVEHWGRNTTGLAMQGAVVKSASRSLMKGMMVIRNPARGSDSHLKQHALLLTHDSFANAIPGLEIETNDLKAKHAASVSQPDDEQLFYLASRGFTKDEAVMAVAAGTVEHVVKNIKDDAVKEALYSEIRSALASS